MSRVGPKVIAVQIKVRDPPCGRILLSPGVIMNCDRTPGEVVVEVGEVEEEEDPLVPPPRCRNTDPLDLLAATSAVLSL